MKKHTLSILIFSLFLFTMFLTVCANHLYLYEGESRSESEEGTLVDGAFANSLEILRVNGNDLGLESDSQNNVLHLLSGEHTVFVSPSFFVVWYEEGSKSDAKKALARKLVDG